LGLEKVTSPSAALTLERMEYSLIFSILSDELEIGRVMYNIILATYLKRERQLRTLSCKRNRRLVLMSGKTNAMRILDRKKIDYDILTYDVGDGKIDGVAVSKKINRSKEMVYKTLVAHREQNLFIFVIPVAEELDLKKAAKAAGEKKIEMLPVKHLQKWTGYIRGGCSPVGMKKNYPTFIDSSAYHLQKIVVSAGKIGMQIEIEPGKLADIVEAQFLELTK
jgi:Cys-tRNA(Pro)/Cys-tRNA(Cys) deacylase